VGAGSPAQPGAGLLLQTLPEMTSWQAGPPVRVEGRWEASGVLRPSSSPAWMGLAQAGQGGCMRERG